MQPHGLGASPDLGWVLGAVVRGGRPVDAFFFNLYDDAYKGKTWTTSRERMRQAVGLPGDVLFGE
jgi:hypothetical protein